jgi:hypothetical protein
MASTQIAGTVTDKDGNAVAGAKIIAVPDSELSFPANGAESQETPVVVLGKTDSNGAFTLSDELLPEIDDYHVIARWTDTNGNLHQATPNYPGVTAEAPTTLIDGFEDGDIAEYGGGTGEFSVQTNTVYNGSYALEHLENNAATISQTDTVVSAPVTVRARKYLTGGTFGGTWFMTQGEGDEGSGLSGGYLVQPYRSGTDFRLFKYDSGFTTLVEETSNMPTDKWCYVTLNMDDSSPNVVTAKGYDSNGNKVNEVSATDDTFTSGGTGHRSGNSGNPHYTDEVVFY